MKKLLVLLSAALMLAACGPFGGGRGEEPTGAQEPGETVFPVGVSTAVRGQMLDYLRLNGDVETSSAVDVFAETVGEITSIPVRIGQRVERNQVIAEVDPSRPGQRFTPSPVRAPISGTIVALPMQVGARLSQGQAVARIATTSDLQIRTHIPERYIGQVSLGERAIVSLSAYPDARFNARVTETSPVLDPQSRTMELTLRLERPDVRIRPGMFAQVRLITQEKTNTVKLPANAVVRRFGEAFVFVVVNSSHDDNGEPSVQRVERRPVTTGIQIDETVEILEGLSGGEVVVVQGQNLLDDSARVNVVTELEPLPREASVR
ncbi:MAG: efflux RND transporter periplasmic adaptor subunit [Spirochaetaceae bacterium]|nr:MAG: efflux RND transporter periplasmic adaptor subunit [Spirochaetaceae bacterium]